jgi:hypothetical protein
MGTHETHRWHLPEAISGVSSRIIRAVNKIFGELTWAFEHLRECSRDRDLNFHRASADNALRQSRHYSEMLLVDVKAYVSRYDTKANDYESVVKVFVELDTSIRSARGRLIEHFHRADRRSIDSVQSAVRGCCEISQRFMATLKRGSESKGKDGTLFGDLICWSDREVVLAYAQGQEDAVGQLLTQVGARLEDLIAQHVFVDRHFAGFVERRALVAKEILLLFQEGTFCKRLIQWGWRPIDAQLPIGTAIGEDDLDVKVLGEAVAAADLLRWRHLRIAIANIQLGLELTLDCRDYGSDCSELVDACAIRGHTAFVSARDHICRMRELLSLGNEFRIG